MEKVFRRLSDRRKRFPSAFWTLAVGSFIFTLGSSLMWPYLNLYLQEKLNVPLRYSSLLISVRAASSGAASLFAGGIADRFGRLSLILSSLLGGVFYYLGLKYSANLWQLVLLMVFWGILDLCYPVGINAMVADIIPEKDRLEAYSIIRVTENVGYAIGPVIGGFLVARSYDYILFGAAAGYLISFVYMLTRLKESYPKSKRGKVENDLERSGSILVVLRDRPFFWSVLLMGMIYLCSSGVFNLLSYYAGRVFQISEERISLVFTVNASLCVFAQLWVIRLIRGKKPLLIMMVSGFLYALGVLGYAGFPSVLWYCLCMSVMTVGELLMTPTMSGLAASLAPENARGRYMGILSLARPVGQSIGPALMGYCYDMISPRSMWLVGALFPLVAGAGYFMLHRAYGKTERLLSVN